MRFDFELLRSFIKKEIVFDFSQDRIALQELLHVLSAEDVHWQAGQLAHMYIPTQDSTYNILDWNGHNKLVLISHSYAKKYNKTIVSVSELMKQQDDTNYSDILELV